MKDRSGQNPTLSPIQWKAIDLMLQGQRDGEIAKALKVQRQTINGWRNHDEDFQEAFNQARLQTWEESQERLRLLCSRAIDTLNRALDEDNVQAALGVLKVAAAFERIPAMNAPEKTEVIVSYNEEGLPCAERQELEMLREKCGIPTIR